MSVMVAVGLQAVPDALETTERLRRLEAEVARLVNLVEHAKATESSPAVAE
jgi:hypothetical protein